MGDTSRDSAGDAAKIKPSRLRRVNDWAAYRAKRVQEHRFGAAAISILMIIVGYFINSGLDAITHALTGPDQFLSQIHEKQTTEFKKIEDGLADLRSQLPKSESATLASVDNALASLKQTNQDLVDKLVTAQKRNNALSRDLENQSGVSGGYDFMLGENDGLRLDATSYLGVTRVYSNAVNIRLTSSDSDRSRSGSLNPGESVSYTAASGQACKIILLSPNADTGQATFDKSCVDKNDTSSEAG